MQQRVGNNSAEQNFWGDGPKNSFKADLATTPQRWKENDCHWDESEIVWLLNGRDDKKINWDHEKLLPWDESQDSVSFQRECLINVEGAIKSESDQQDGPEQLLQISCQKQEVKTPQLSGPLEALKDELRCEFQLESKSKEQREEGKEGKCRCKKSKCLKMYCECFRSGRQCIDCGCVDCKNNATEHESRRKAIKMIKEKEPMAFTPTSQYKGCKCTKTRCLKGYCECFLNGHMCGKYCRCRDCFNCKAPLKSKPGTGREHTK